jgi:hypothetical protein
MSYSSQRESETSSQCETILNDLLTLKDSIRKGPRLTLKKEKAFQESLAAIQFVYEDLAKHCRKNLRAG